jgi:hypothetical protein
MKFGQKPLVRIRLSIQKCLNITFQISDLERIWWRFGRALLILTLIVFHLNRSKIPFAASRWIFWKIKDMAQLHFMSHSLMKGPLNFGHNCFSSKSFQNLICSNEMDILAKN